MLNKMKSKIALFSKDEDGATLVEYGIALGLAITVGTTAIFALAGDVEATMGSASDALPTQADDSSTGTGTGSI